MKKFCTNCGQELDENIKFCVNCGKKVNYVKDIDLNTDTKTKTNSFTPKSKIAAGLMGIFLGGLGIHNFYLGYTGKAIAQLLMTLLSSGLLYVASSIWGFVEGIMILTVSINHDADGNPLTK